MFRLVLNRIAVSAPLILIVTLLTFVLNSFAPGDLAATILQGETSIARYDELRAELGLDKPVLEQYGHWLINAVQGDLGKSHFTGESVVQMLNDRFFVSLSIILGSLLVCVAIRVSLGLISALRGGFIRRAVDVISIVALIFPSFWVALVLISVFAVWLQWFPAVGYTPFSQNPGPGSWASYCR